ncbi:MAG: GNAT family N-acetyltransferase [Nocardioides sp.]
MPAHSPRPGSHLLGPHVIGQRVVVRHILPGEAGPSGGPALTDVLGVVIHWTDEQATLRREDGSLVRVEIGHIVSGKPVPPRPSIRHRVSPRQAQRKALSMFPDLVTEPVGTWILRSSATSSARRANSVLAIGDHAQAPADQDTVRRVTEWYAARDRRPVAAVLTDSPEAELLRAAGWLPHRPEADSLFLVASVAHALRSATSTQQVRIEQDAEHAVVRIDDPVPCPATGPTSGIASDIASGRATYAEEWLGLRGIEVVAGRRRRGYGLAVMSALLEWGAEHGARTAYLQVFDDNAPALALYTKLGFSVHHTYRYLAAP